MRLVVDTNELVHALMRPAELATFAMSWEAGRFVVVCSEPLRHEYLKVLQQPKIIQLLTPESVRAFYDNLAQDMEMVNLIEIRPISRDPSDDKVIATAIVGKVDFLVTEDEDLRTPNVIAELQANNIQLMTIDELMRLL